jgi:two-component system, OmpR family, response regulator MprA
MRTILLMDDDPDLLALLARALAKDGFRVVKATNVAQALELSAREEPHLIIADLMMPHVDGEAFLARYRQRWPDSTCPVMLLTASIQRDEVARRMRVDASLPKPFMLDELRGLVRELTSPDQGAQADR